MKQTPNLLHLHQQFEATLKSIDSLLPLIRELSPTPAVLGYPKQEAIEWLQRHETFSRGLYSSSIGWSANQSHELIVAIRSGLIKKNTVHLFTGLGIVSESDPLLEWEELNHKLKLLLPYFYAKHATI
jgi:menaquinone-specific isochorismate synthase